MIVFRIPSPHRSRLTLPARRRVATAVLVVLAATLAVLSAALPAQALTTHTVSSPDGGLSLTVRNEDDGSLTYRVTAGGTTVLPDAPLGLTTNAADFTTGVSFTGESRRTIDDDYSLPAGTKRSYTDHANELTLSYVKDGRAMQLVVRAYDDGVAFRYVLPGSGTVSITGEASGFGLPTGTGGWAATWRQDYEGDYQYRGAGDLAAGQWSMPVLASVNDNSYFALLTEASVYNANGSYAPSLLSGGTDGVLRVARTPDQGFPMTSSYPFRSPWRVAVVAPDLDTLVNTDLVQHLNPASSATDLSWVRPGRAAWSWYTDETSAADVDKQKRYVDFAAAMGFEYVTVDCCYVKADLPTIAEYAHSQGVGVFAWVTADSINTPALADAELSLLRSYGIDGVKVDFFLRDSQDVTGWYQTIAEAAGRHRMMVNFHGSTKPGGENRTWPWVVTSEAVAGAEHYKYPPPSSARLDATLPFTRNPLGGMDYTPVAFSDVPTAPPAVSTQAHVLAQAVVFTSAMVHYADSAAAYEQWPGRHLLRALPTTWDETRLLSGFPGSDVTLARRSGQTWYVGALTDAARTVQVPLSFLGGGSYTATVFAENGTGGIAVTKQAVTSGTTLTLPLSAAGGAAVHLSREALPQTGSGDARYEAEAAGNVRTGSAATTSCAGCSGRAKVGDLGPGATLTFTGVRAPVAGVHELRLTYTTQDARALRVEVNDSVAATLTPPTSGGWNVVGDVTFDVALRAGTNTIRLSGAEGYAPDIDALTLARSVEAEDPGNVLGGGAMRSGCDGCSGGVKVGYLGGSGTLEVRGLSVTTAGNKSVRIDYASADPRVAQLSVNGGAPVSVSFPATGSWTTTATRTVGLDLAAGTNTLRFSAPGGYAPDIDRITVSD